MTNNSDYQNRIVELAKDILLLSGIHSYYGPEELIGKTLIAITNLILLQRAEWITKIIELQLP